MSWLPTVWQARLPFPRERRSSSASVRPGLASLENKRSQSRLSGLLAISRTRGSRCGGFRAPLRRTPPTKIGESRAQSGGPLCCASSPPYGSRLKSSFFSPPLFLCSATDIKIRRYHRCKYRAVRSLYTKTLTTINFSILKLKLQGKIQIFSR